MGIDKWDARRKLLMPLQNKKQTISFLLKETIDGDHGRIGKRAIYTVNDIDSLQSKEMWSKLNTIDFRYIIGRPAISTRNSGAL